jgi:hypothetical protein
MGLMDTIKGWVGGNKQKASGGVDKAAGVVKDKVPDQHDKKVDQAADAAKDQINKLDGS